MIKRFTIGSSNALSLAVCLSLGLVSGGCKKSADDEIAMLPTVTNPTQIDDIGKDLAERFDPDVARKVADAESSSPNVSAAMAKMESVYSQAMAQADSDKQQKIVACLANLPLSSSATELSEIIRYNSNSDVKSLALTSLESMKESLSVPALFQAVQTQDSTMRGEILTNLGGRGESLLPELMKECESDYFPGAGLIFEKIGTPAIEPLMDRMQNAAWAKDALAHIGQPAVDPLLAKMKTDDRDVKFAAAEALVRMKACHPDAISGLLNVLDAKDLGGIAENYAFYIRLGQDGTQGLLLKALDGYFTTSMCVDYLNCGNEQLGKGAGSIARAHGYNVTSEFGSHGGPRWGEGN